MTEVKIIRGDGGEIKGTYHHMCQIPRSQVGQLHLDISADQLSECGPLDQNNQVQIIINGPAFIQHIEALTTPGMYRLVVNISAGEQLTYLTELTGLTGEKVGCEPI